MLLTHHSIHKIMWQDFYPLQKIFLISNVWNSFSSRSFQFWSTWIIKIYFNRRGYDNWQFKLYVGWLKLGLKIQCVCKLGRFLSSTLSWYLIKIPNCPHALFNSCKEELRPYTENPQSLQFIKLKSTKIWQTSLSSNQPQLWKESN